MMELCDVFTIELTHLNLTISLDLELMIVLILLLITAYNFSHRIDHLSFGEEIPGIINPLDGTEKVCTDRKYKDITSVLGSNIIRNNSKTYSVLDCFHCNRQAQ